MEDFLNTQAICSMRLREFRSLELTCEKLCGKRYCMSRDENQDHMENTAFLLHCLKALKLIFRVWNYLPGCWSINNNNNNSDGWYLLSFTMCKNGAHGLHTLSIKYSPKLFMVADIYPRFTEEEMTNMKSKNLSLSNCSPQVFDRRWFCAPSLPSQETLCNVWRHFWLRLGWGGAIGI